MRKNALPQFRVTEIFFSIQGEALTSGLPTVFVRLTGCPLRCQYCDTTYAFKGGKHYTLSALMETIHSYGCNRICVTGGEPLAQPSCLLLLKELCDANYHVSLETSGALNIAAVDPRVSIVMDLKTPGSAEAHKNLWSNIDFLKADDQIKIVICSREDYDWACDQINKYQLIKRCHILFSASWKELNPTMLAEWILKDRLAVRFQIQLHKILWNDAPGH